jgi:hypothetical protein
VRIKSLARDLRFYAILAFLALAIAVAASGPQGLAGMSLGLSSGTFGAVALWQLIQLTGKAMSTGGNTKTATIVTVLAFFAKLPVYAGCGMLATRIGPTAFSCFLVGVVLVYFGLIVWAMARP